MRRVDLEAVGWEGMREECGRGSMLGPGFGGRKRRRGTPQHLGEDVDDRWRCPGSRAQGLHTQVLVDAGCGSLRWMQEPRMGRGVSCMAWFIGRVRT